MKKASISETKNNLSRLLDFVRRGETVLIMDRRTPVARIEPIRPDSGTDESALAVLVAEGIAAPPEQRLDVDAFLAKDGPRLARGTSAVEALLKDRRESP